MTTLTMGARDGEFLIKDFDPSYNREAIVLNSGQNLKGGTVLGRLLAAGAATAVGSPTGNGVITIGAFGPSAVIGTYKLVCVAAASNAGTFNFYAPDGSLIRQITVGGGATSSDHFVVTIADGSTDFAAGDSYTVAVTGGDYTQLDTAATTGAQIAAAILFAAVNASSADTAAVGVVRGPVIAESAALTWPAGITDAQKAAATSTLAKAGIVVR